MKRITVFIMLFGVLGMYGQGASCGAIAVQIVPTSTNPAGTQLSFDNAKSLSGSMIGGVTNVSKLYQAKGSGANSNNALLYSNWDNAGTIYTAKSNYNFKSLNFDLQRGKVLIKGDDSQIYTLSTNNIQKLIIEKDAYQVSLNSRNGDYQLFQIVHQADDGFKVLKGYELRLKEASPHAMLNMGKQSRIVKKERYYVSKGAVLKPIKTNKKKMAKMQKANDFKALRSLLNKNDNRRVVSN